MGTREDTDAGSGGFAVIAARRPPHGEDIARNGDFRPTPGAGAAYTCIRRKASKQADRPRADSRAVPHLPPAGPILTVLTSTPEDATVSVRHNLHGLRKARGMGKCKGTPWQGFRLFGLIPFIPADSLRGIRNVPVHRCPGSTGVRLPGAVSARRGRARRGCVKRTSVGRRLSHREDFARNDDFHPAAYETT